MYTVQDVYTVYDVCTEQNVYTIKIVSMSISWSHQQQEAVWSVYTLSRQTHLTDSVQWC